MEISENKTARNEFLDIIKAVCILFVIITHDSISDSFRLKTLFPFWINMAVPMFMIISGYVYAISFEKNNISEIQQAYSPQFLIPKCIRYTIPFVMAFCVETIGELICANLGIRSFSVMHWASVFFEGGAVQALITTRFYYNFFCFIPLFISLSENMRSKDFCFAFY